MRALPPRFFLLLVVVLGLLLFYLDLVTLDVQFWLPSLLLLIVAYRWGTRRDIYATAAILSVLILLNYRLEEGWTFAANFLDHFMPFAVLWVMAWLLAQHRSLQDQLALQHRQLLRHEQELEEQIKTNTAYEHLRLAVEAANIGIWNWNLVDNSLEWDDRVCEIYAVPAAVRQSGVTYAFWRSRVHPDDLAVADPDDGDPLRAGDHWSDTYRIVLPDGAIRHILSGAVLQYDHDGRPRRMIGINRDITDQVQYEQLLQASNSDLEQRVAARTADLEIALAELQRANALKDEFMAMISHELRTPLTGVLSMAELLEDQIAGPLNERQTFYTKGIVASGERLLAVINGILSYTHLISGKLRLEQGPLELGHLLGICAASQKHKADAKQQTIAVTVVPADLRITGDATALAEVLKRLLDNAVKFTPQGGQIGLEAQAGRVPGTVELSVWDTGIGIADGQLAHVVRPFAQADGSLARGHDGIGMGLAYVDQMVRLMGGTLQLESEPGRGSRFTVTLPAGGTAQ